MTNTPRPDPSDARARLVRGSQRGYAAQQVAREAEAQIEAERTAYLADLGVSHLYLSPILQPTPGSTHGYDVVDHTSLNAEAGGREAFDRLVEAAHAAGLGIIVDVVRSSRSGAPRRR